MAVEVVGGFRAGSRLPNAATIDWVCPKCMVRPCVASGFRRSGGFAVLHQCIRSLNGACCAPDHHGNQRAYALISGQASSGPFGAPGFACAVKTDPPSRLILSALVEVTTSITEASMTSSPSNAVHPQFVVDERHRVAPHY